MDDDLPGGHPPTPLPQRLFYGLPTGVQLRVRSAKRALFGEHDWAEAVKQLRLDEAEFIRATETDARAAGGSKRIAIYSLHHFSPVEYGLAAALRLRGHDVRGLLCDGLLPLCEHNLGPRWRPPCETCIGSMARFEDAFGFEYDRLTRFLSDADRVRAEAIVAATPDEGLLALSVEEVPVGKLAHRELQRYHRGFVFDAISDPAYRRWIVSAVLCTWLSQRWLEDVSPDIVGVCSGRTLNTACVYHVARQRGIRVVTWDGAATHPDTLVFSHDRPASEVPMDDAWERVSGEELSAERRARLDAYLGRWARSKNTPFPYNPAPMDDPRAIRVALGLREGVPLVAAFTNTSWDIAVIDRDVGFASMFEWLFALVEAARRAPGTDFVIRAHPAEVKVPDDLRTRSPVGAEIRKRFPALPANLRIVEGGDPVSSYALASMADVNMVYASRFGLELALKGLRPWVAGAVTYRGKGFSCDLTSPDHMQELLDAGDFGDALDEGQIELAHRFAYLWFFRYEVPLPLLRPPDHRFNLSSFKQLAPGGDAVLDRVCAAFAHGTPFLDLAPHADELGADASQTTERVAGAR